VQADGRIVIAGSQRQGGQIVNVMVARFTPTGGLDSSFSGGLFLHGYAVGAGYSAAKALVLQPDGKIVIAGTALDGSVGADALVARLTASGQPDTGFGPGGDGAVRLPATAHPYQYTQEGVQPYPGALGVGLSGSDIVAAGYFDSFGVRQLALWALTGNGTPDTNFGSQGRTLALSGTQASALAVDPSGRLLAAGETGGGDGLAARYEGLGPPPPPPTPLPGTPSPPPAEGIGPGGGANTGGGPANTGGGPGRLRITASIGGTYRLDVLLRSGLLLPVTCNQACTIRAALTVPSTVANRAHLVAVGQRTVTIASGSAKLTRAGRISVRLRLTRTAKRALARQQRLLATLSVRVTAGQQVAVSSRTVRIQRPVPRR
jgi:uncharacterized delta-60 repeat protein